MRAALVAFMGPAMLGACCSPNTCAPARRGFAVLEPVTEAILAYETGTGHLPLNLAEAGIVAGPGLPPGADLAFASGREMVPVTWGANAGGEPELALRFSYHGPGVNHCSWQASRPAWVCTGYY